MAAASTLGPARCARFSRFSASAAGARSQLLRSPPYCCPCFVQAAARPQVTVFSAENGEATSTVAMPAVFTAPIRMDLVHEVHVNMSKNR